jgi:hypothetical protein
MNDETATKEVTKKQTQELAALMKDFDLESRAGEAQEGATQEDYAMPFLALLQSGSPQVKKSDPRYIKGASEGMFLNTVTGEVLDAESGVTVVPCAYRRAFIEWKLREEGGGFVKEHPVNHGIKTILDDANRDIIPDNGNELKDTRYWYVLVLEEGKPAEPAVIGMTRTQIKPSRMWFTLQGRNEWPDGKERLNAPPSYVWTYKLGVNPQQKDEFSFWNFTIERGDPVTDPKLIKQAIDFHDAVKAGEVKEATDSLSETESEQPSSTDNY